MRYGVNLFGPYETMKQDAETFFATVKSAGYCYVEPCVTLGEKIAAYPQFLTLEELAEYQEIYTKAGLSVFSSHVMVEHLDTEQDVEVAADQLVAMKDQFDCNRMIINHSCEWVEEKAAAYAGLMKKLAQKLAPHGISLLLHNGKDDILAKIQGISAYEWLLKACDGLVGAQPDTGWMLAGGGDPEAFCWRNRHLIGALHYKDVKKTSGGAYVETPVGTGLTDMEACFQFARAMEVPQFLDQDQSEDWLADIKRVAGLFGSLIQCRSNSDSILCVYDTETREVTKLHTFPRVIEAPNWLRDGDTLIYNSEGLIWKYQISTGVESLIPTGSCNNCNNDHVLSPDHSQIAVSHSEESWMSRIYILPIEGGEPRLITPNAPSFLHGWSPDGKELAYCAFRNHGGEGFEVDVYAISAEGGEERQLTSNAVFNDGPEYAPDGTKIWFNSTRTGLMQIWRMNTDGSDQTQMTFEEQNNWFAHVSPDGKKVVNLAYSKDGLAANEHLPNMDVELWMMDADGGNRERILRFFGGQGSINVNSWAPDSKKFAFVMYELHHK